MPDDCLVDALDHLERLIAFETICDRSNLPLIDWAADLLASHGARLRYTFDDGRTKANLFASIGPEVEGGVVLSGHTDVVPVEGQAWTSDPFRLTRRYEGLHRGRPRDPAAGDGGIGGTVLAWSGDPDPAFDWSLIVEPSISHEVSLGTARVLSPSEIVEAVQAIVGEVVTDIVQAPGWQGATLASETTAP